MIVDGNNLLARSIHAATDQSGMPRMVSEAGVWTGPLVLFVGLLAKRVRIESPERLLVVWDGGTAEWRRQRLPGYKAHRRPVPDDRQAERDSVFELAYHFCALAGIPTMRLMGYEADDLIAGAWVGLGPREANQIVIVSDDKDFLQLVGPNHRGVDTELVRRDRRDGQTDRWTEMRVVDELGHAPARWALMTALAGDSSDGVSGLPGVGPVKARKLLEAAEWDWDRLIRGLTPQQARLANDCRDVVDLRVPGLVITTPPWRPTGHADVLWRDLIEFLSAHELRGLKEDLEAQRLWSNRDLISVTESDDDRNGGSS
jgi:5'-3' exonuclease